MNPRFYLPIAILASLSVHFTLIAWLVPKTPLSQNDGQGIIQVTFQKNDGRLEREQGTHTLKTASANIKDKETTQKPATGKSIQKPASANLPLDNNQDRQISGQLHWQLQPANQQNQIMIAMQQSKMVHERELRKNSILAGLSNLSVTLRPLVTEKIVCLQQTANEIKCTPIQKEETQIILRQFFELALEAHNLGIAENPVSIDFGAGMGVSVTLLSTP